MFQIAYIYALQMELPGLKENPVYSRSVVFFPVLRNCNMQGKYESLDLVCVNLHVELQQGDRRPDHGQ